MFKFILLATTTLILSACATGTKFSQIEQGMHRSQVESILGKPDTLNKMSHTTMYKYQNRAVSGWGYDTADYYIIIGPDDKVVQYGREKFKAGAVPKILTAPQPASAAPTTITCDSSTMGTTTYTDCKTK